MDISYVFTNEQTWIEKLTKSGHTFETLCELSKEMIEVFQLIEVQYLEDLIYRLKIVSDFEKGKDFDIEADTQMPLRVSVEADKKPYFFRICPQEKSFKRTEMHFYCENCGPEVKLNLSNLKQHALVHK